MNLEQRSNISRRDFIKKVGWGAALLAGIFGFSRMQALGFLKNLEQNESEKIFDIDTFRNGFFDYIDNVSYLKNAYESTYGKREQKIVEINRREDWYPMSWEGLKERYNNNLGDSYSFGIEGPRVPKNTKTRVVNTFPYYNNPNFSPESLEKILTSITVHHTEMEEWKADGVGDDAKKQMQFLFNSQVISGFNDIAYHFAITPDGQIFEGVPLSHIGSHSGNTEESAEYLNKNLKGGLSSIANEKDRDKKQEKVNHYKNAMKKDPDYGSVGIVLLGNFNKGEPTDAQIASLLKLTNFLKNTFHIPKDNVIGHREVKEKIVDPSGLTLSTRDKDCPGTNFDLDKFRKNLDEDTPESLDKLDRLKLPRD